ncbi:hypothetical protein [Solimonas variicoloris]|uniref:hypothetical protein n=1 Tax=Solimonas variicoloris TaxID=254408 RepID=UPI0003642051|nr:hypothetical protein [Solimonas variicoloris]
MKRTLFLIAAWLGTAVAQAAAPLGAEFRVNGTTALDQQRPALARAGNGRFVIAWDSSEAGGAAGDVYARRYAADGTPLGAEFRVNSTTRNRQYAPRVAVDADGGFVAAWLSNAQHSVGLSLYARRYGADGVPLGPEFRVDRTGRATSAQFDVAMAPNGAFVVVWVDRDAIVGASLQARYVNAQRYTRDGWADGAPIAVYDSTLFQVRVPSVASDAAGNFVVAWFVGANSIWARRYDAAGRARGPGFRVSTAGDQVDRPRIAASAGGAFAIAWETGDEAFADTGVYLRAYNAAGHATMAPARVDRRMLRFPEIAFTNDTQLVVAAHGDAIYGQCWNVTGTALGGAFRVDASPTLHTPLLASVASDGGGQLLFAWQNFSVAAGRDIYARLFSRC